MAPMIYIHHCSVGQLENEKKMKNLEIKEQVLHMHHLIKQPHYFLGYLFSSGLKPQTLIS